MHTITTFLGQRDVPYELVGHRHTLTSRQTAREAQVPGGRIAKGVLFADDRDYVLAVVPASARVDAQRLCRVLGRPTLALAGEDELALMFPDCEVGAVPALGAAYGVGSIVDASLRGADAVYLEVGDHLHLVRIDGHAFERLQADASWGAIRA